MKSKSYLKSSDLINVESEFDLKSKRPKKSLINID